LFILLILVELF